MSKVLYLLAIYFLIVSATLNEKEEKKKKSLPSEEIAVPSTGTTTAQPTDASIPTLRLESIPIPELESIEVTSELMATNQESNEANNKKRTRGLGREIREKVKGKNEEIFDGKRWKYNGAYKGAKYYKCLTTFCQATKKVKGSDITFRGEHDEKCKTLIPLTTKEEIIRQHENGKTKYEITRTISSAQNQSLPFLNSPMAQTPSPFTPIFNQRGIHAAIGSHLRNIKPMSCDTLNAINSYPGFIRSVAIFPDFQIFMATDESLDQLGSNQCPVLMLNGTHSMLNLNTGNQECQLITAGVLIEEKDTFLSVAHFICASKEARAYQMFVYLAHSHQWSLGYFFFF